MTLRVALISTPFVSVPPKGYGGTELVVADLAKALRARGADVVVYATGGSDLPGIEIRSYFPAPQWPPDRDIERVHATWSLRDCGARSARFRRRPRAIRPPRWRWRGCRHSRCSARCTTTTSPS